MKRNSRLIPLVVVLAAALAVSTACGGGGPNTSGPADGVITEGEGSAPTTLPPDDPGGPSDEPTDPGPGSVMAQASTPEFVLTLTIETPAPGPASSLGLPTFVAPEPVTFRVELHNVSGRPQTILMLGKPFQGVGGRHRLTGTAIWPPVLTFAPPMPHLVTFAPNERQSATKVWLTSRNQLGAYDIEGRIGTTDARVPKLAGLALELK